MKKVSVVFAAMATAVALSPFALADTLTVSYSAPLTGPDNNNVFVNSDIGSFDETETFTNDTAFTVDITSVGVPDLTTHTNDGNRDPGNPNDTVTSVNILADTCKGADLSVDGSCEVELQVFVTGAAPSGKQGDDTDSYGDNKIQLTIDGEGGKKGTTAVNTKSEFVATVDYVSPAPEPEPLVLLGTGFGFVGLVAFLRRRAVARPAIA